MTGEGSTQSSPWHDLAIGAFGFVLGILTSVIVYGKTDWRPSELLGLIIAIVAVVLSLVAFVDSRSIIHKLDALTNMTAFQQGRMDYIAQAVQRAATRGGGTVLIPPGPVTQ